MVLEATGNLKQFWKSPSQLKRALEIFRKFSVAFKSFWHIKNRPRSFW